VQVVSRVLGVSGHVVFGQIAVQHHFSSQHHLMEVGIRRVKEQGEKMRGRIDAYTSNTTNKQREIRQENINY